MPAISGPSMTCSGFSACWRASSVSISMNSVMPCTSACFNRSTTGTVLSTLRAWNPALWLVVGGAAALLTLVVGIPGLRDLFGFAPLHVHDLVVVAVASLAALLWIELVRLLRHRVDTRPPGARPARAEGRGTP